MHIQVVVLARLELVGGEFQQFIDRGVAVVAGDRLVPVPPDAVDRIGCGAYFVEKCISI